MVIGQQQAIRREQDAGTAAFAPSASGAQIDHGGPQHLGHAHHHIGVRIERFPFARIRFGQRIAFHGTAAVADEMLPERHGVARLFREVSIRRTATLL